MTPGELLKLSWRSAGLNHVNTVALSQNKPLYFMNCQCSPGVKNGLQLVVNVEQYEYTNGPHNAVGLKLLLHQQDGVPLVQDFGESVPVGMHTFVAVSHTKVGVVFKQIIPLHNIVC